MAMPPLNGLFPLASSLLSPAEEVLRPEATQNAARVESAVEDSLELSLRAEQLLGQRKNDVQSSPAGIPAVEDTARQKAALADDVSISTQGRAALENAQVAAVPMQGEQNARDVVDAVGSVPTRNVLTTATLNSGATVSVYATAYAEGEEKPFFLAPDQKIMAEITRTDGSTETLTIRGNTIISEDEQGNLLVQFGPEKYKTSDRNEILEGTDGNDVIINLNGVDEIYVGKGNDTILSFNDIQKVDLGDGDNSITAHGGAISSITAGDGNNAISNVVAGHISLGHGDNAVTGSDISSLLGGDGNNSISGFGKVREIHLGNGDNAVAVASADLIRIGNGNNSVKISGSISSADLSETAGPEIRLGDGGNMVEVEAAKLIQAGNGHNTVKINSHADINGRPLVALKQKIQLGDGNNVVSADYASEITMGNGDNNISGNIHNMTVGNGNNAIDASLLNVGGWVLGRGSNDVHIAVMNGSLTTGGGENDGDSTVTIDGMRPSSKIKTGSGNDSVHIRGDVYGMNVNLGNGDNSFAVDGNAAYLEYRGGDGRDNVMIKGFLAHSTVKTGKGDDTLTVQGVILNSLIDAGLGDNSLHLNRLVIDSMINGAATGKTSEEEKAAALDDFDRFMTRWNMPSKAEAVEV